MKSKRLFACLTVVILLAVSLPLSALAETYATVISFDVLHLRSGPGSEYAILGKYRRGTRVEIQNTGRRWARVRTPDRKTGYMYMQYLSSFTRTTGNTGSSSGSSSANYSASTGSGTGIGTGFRYIKSGIGPVNFRKDASVTSKLLDQLQGGTVVMVLSSGDTWSRVRYNGTLGWIKTRYLVKTRN